MLLEKYTTDPMPVGSAADAFVMPGLAAYVVMASPGEIISGIAEVEETRPDVRPDGDLVIVDPDGKRLYYDHIAPGTSKSFAYQVTEGGLYSIVFDAEKNLNALQVDNQYFSMIVPPSEEITIAYGPKEAYFMADKNADEIRLWVSRGVCMVDLFDPDEVQVTFDDGSPIYHNVGPGEDEEPWSIRCRPGIPTRDEGLQNLVLTLGLDCGDLLAVHPTRLLKDIPFSNPVGDIDGNYKVDFPDFSLMAENWQTEGIFTEAGWVVPNFDEALEPPSNGPFIPMTSGDFGQGYNHALVKTMLWDSVNIAYTHTDSTRSLNYMEHGNVTAGTYGPIISDPTGTTSTAFPAIHFVAPVAGVYSIDGTAVLSGQKSRCYVQKVTDTGASVVGSGWTTASDVAEVKDCDFGADAGLQNISLLAGEGLAIMVYSQLASEITTSLNLGGDGTDPVKIIDEEGDPVQISPVGDLDEDYTVDLMDVEVMAQNWLLDCTATPHDPACQIF